MSWNALVSFFGFRWQDVKSIACHCCCYDDSDNNYDNDNDNDHDHDDDEKYHTKML